MAIKQTRTNNRTSITGNEDTPYTTIPDGEIHVGFQSGRFTVGRNRRGIPQDRQKYPKEGQSKRENGKRPRLPSNKVYYSRGRHGLGCNLDKNIRFSSTTIKSIEELNVDTPWDITVENAHSYLAQGFVNHNSSPNSQNLNAFIRGQFIARPGYNILQFDLSQAEVRAVAAFSGDQNLIKAFTEGDIHSNIASVIYKCDPKDVTKEQRRFTKTVVFGIIYGRGAYALSLALGCSKEEAQEFIDKFFSTFPDLKNWLDEQKKLARRKPYYIYTPWGTRRSTRNILSTDKAEVAHIERISQNMPIQGAAGELTLWYICEILDAFEEAGIEGYLVNTTHDSVALEIPCEYAYSVVIGEDDNGKEIKIIKGKAYNIVSNILNATVPIEPLDKVKFAADIDLSTYWECKPDLLRAIDPEKGGEKSLFRWDIIKAEEVMDKEELAEFMDVLNVMD